MVERIVPDRVVFTDSPFDFIASTFGRNIRAYRAGSRVPFVIRRTVPPIVGNRFQGRSLSGLLLLFFFF